MLGEGLPLGRSREESEQMLQETEEAVAAQLSFDGVFDLRPAVDACVHGVVLKPLQLAGITTTLQAAMAMAEATQHGGYEALARLAAGIRDAAPLLEGMQADICRRIDVAAGRIRDDATPRLAALRQRRAAASAELAAEAARWAAQVFQQGGSERATVVARRNRQCVGIRKGRQSLLPAGSLVLARSASGATLYMEPAPCIQLNNEVTCCAMDEQEEEQRILSALCQQVAANAAAVLRAMASLAWLDLANARACHARWLGGRRPTFVSWQQGQAQGPVQLRGVVHPLLAQMELPPLPDMPTADELFLDEETAALREQQRIVAELTAAASEARQPGAGGEGTRSGGGVHIHPTDLQVPAGVRVVVVTGPNTGGKTVSLKALGLAALMARAGLFLRMRSATTDAAPDAASACRLVWFDRVMADIGDAQSLDQNLSTFSGHVRRTVQILNAATPRSLVLLDEVGSGTDPREGAALAAAVLQRLAAQAGLAVATAHHAELKQLWEQDDRFVSASMEFDVASLRPTYRMLWGVAGASNALAVAGTLGFDRTVIAAARQAMARKALQDEQQAAARAAMAGTVMGDIADAQKRAAATRSALQATKAELQQLRQQLLQTRRQLAESAKAVPGRGGNSKKKGARKQADAASASIPRALARRIEAVGALSAAAACGRGDAAQLRLAVSELEAELPAAEEAAAELMGFGASAARQGWEAKKGEAVLVMTPAQLTPTRGVVRSRSGDRVKVLVGRLEMLVKKQHIRPLDSGSQPSTPASPSPSGSSSRRDRDGYRASAPPPGSAEGVDVRTSSNTFDVRGMRAEQALAEVRSRVSGADAGQVLFVVHGVGTGKLRQAIHDFLRSSRFVASFELEDGTQGGCTQIYIK